MLHRAAKSLAQGEHNQELDRSRLTVLFGFIHRKGRYLSARKTFLSVKKAHCLKRPSGLTVAKACFKCCNYLYFKLLKNSLQSLISISLESLSKFRV